jgi:hypothetical protein
MSGVTVAMTMRSISSGVTGSGHGATGGLAGQITGGLIGSSDVAASDPSAGGDPFV